LSLNRLLHLLLEKVTHPVQVGRHFGVELDAVPGERASFHGTDVFDALSIVGGGQNSEEALQTPILLKVVECESERMAEVEVVGLKGMGLEEAASVLLEGQSGGRSAHGVEGVQRGDAGPQEHHLKSVAGAPDREGAVGLGGEVQEPKGQTPVRGFVGRSAGQIEALELVEIDEGLVVRCTDRDGDHTEAGPREPLVIVIGQVGQGLGSERIGARHGENTDGQHFPY
jgi:hypothetical protein